MYEKTIKLMLCADFHPLHLFLGQTPCDKSARFHQVQIVRVDQALWDISHLRDQVLSILYLLYMLKKIFSNGLQLWMETNFATLHKQFKSKSI